MIRGAVKKEKARLLNVWVPLDLFPYIDEGVRLEDSDRSKFVRGAIRQKLTTLGIKTRKAA